jgi:hypothetical protein
MKTSKRRRVTRLAVLTVGALIAAAASPVAALAATICAVDAFQAHQVAVKRGYIFRCVSPDLAATTFTYVPGGGLICAAKAMPGLKNRNVEVYYFLKEGVVATLRGGWNLGGLTVDGGEFQTGGLTLMPDGRAIVQFRFYVRPGSSTTRTIRFLKLVNAANGLDCNKAADLAF